MGYDWKKAAESQGGEPMPDGLHLATVSKVKTGLTSKKNDPQIIVTFVDSTGTVDSFYTLSKESSWALARLLSALGCDLDAMKADGIEPDHFAKQSVADQHLLDGKTWLWVTTADASKPGNLDKNGNPYKRATPLHEEDAKKKDEAAYTKILEGDPVSAKFNDDIPF